MRRFAFLMVGLAAAQTSTPPTRDPHSPGYVAAKELPDGVNAPPDADGNFILGPTHKPSPEQEGERQGTVITFATESSGSKIYPGIARDAGTFGTVDPKDPAKLVVTTSHPAPYTRSFRFMFRRNMFRARLRRLSWARMGRIRCCSRRSTG